MRDLVSHSITWSKGKSAIQAIAIDYAHFIVSSSIRYINVFYSERRTLPKRIWRAAWSIIPDKSLKSEKSTWGGGSWVNRRFSLFSWHFINSRVEFQLSLRRATCRNALSCLHKFVINSTDSDVVSRRLSRRRSSQRWRFFDTAKNYVTRPGHARYNRIRNLLNFSRSNGQVHQ